VALFNADDNYLFFHIFRTGGMSLRKVFEGCGDDILGGHVLPRDVKKWFESKGRIQEWNDALKFLMVRNPFDWMLSTYFYIVQKPGHNFHKFMQGKSLAEYLRWYEMKTKEPRVYGVNSYATLTEFVTDEDGQQIVDVVLKFEELPTCVHDLRKRMGLPRIEFPHVNITQRKKDYRDYYDDESRALLERIFAEDLERFGYKFE